MDLTACPQCALPAEVEWRAVLESTDGPIEYVRLRCLDRHWFLMPVATLDTSPAHVRARPARGHATGARPS